MADSRPTLGSTAGALLRLAFPLALASVLNLGSLLVDRLWVGAVGTEALAGLGAAHAFWMLVMTLALGLGCGVLAAVARRTGAGDRRSAGRVAVQGVLLALVLGAGVAALSAIVPQLLFAFLGTGSLVGSPAAEYLRLTMLGFVLQAPVMALVFALQGAGRGRSALWVGGAYPLMNIVLDPVCIDGLGLGLPGAAWATVAANGVALLVGLVVVLRHEQEALPICWDDLRLDRALLREIVSVGGPRSLEHLVRNLAGFALMALLVPFGAHVLSAYTASLGVLLVLIFPGLAIGQATASLVGQNLGADRPLEAWRTAWIGVALYAGLMTVAAVGVYANASALVACFDSSPGAVAAGSELLRTLAPVFPGIAVGLVLGKAFGGARRPLPSLAAAAFAHLGVQLPLVLVLAAFGGPRGAYVGMAAAYLIHGVASAALFSWQLRPSRAHGAMA